jgi:hypothetical protein
MKYSPVLERNGVGNDFVPFEGMRRNDSDIVFRFVKSSVHFARPVDDLLFSAHRTIREFDVGQGENVTRYLADNPLAGLGCSVQVCGDLSLMVVRQLIGRSISFALKQSLANIALN